METSKHHSPPPPTVFRLHRVSLVICSCLALAGLLVPREGEVVDRLISDGQYDRALELFGVPRGTTTVLIKHLLLEREGAGKPKHSSELSKLMALCEEPKTIFQFLQLHPALLTDEETVSFRDALAIRAMEMGQPVVASQIYQELSEVQVLDGDQLRRAVTAARYASNPSLGKRLLVDNLEQSHLSYSEFPEDLRRLMITLSRESNEGSEAFDFLADEVELARDFRVRSRLVKELAEVAFQSNRFEEGIPIIRQFVESTQAGQLTWEELKSRQKAHRTDQDFRIYAGMLAASYEWSVQSDPAFDLYRKLALLGDVTALDNCVRISPWVMRQTDLCDLLARVHPVPERPEYDLLLARLKARQGLLEEAESILRGLLTKRENDGALWAELGSVCDERDEFDEAIAAYSKAAALDPGEHETLLIRIARLQVSQGRYREAFAAYSALPLEKHNRKSLEDFSLLASSLKEAATYEQIVRGRMAQARRVRSHDFKQIADAWVAAGDRLRARAVLEEGQEQVPGSQVLNLALIDHDMERQDYERAFRTLGQVFINHDLRYTYRLLDVAEGLENFDEAISLLALKDPLARGWPEHQRLILATLYEKAGQSPTALEIFASVPGGETGAQRIRAEIAYGEGRVEEAWQLQKDYVAMLETFDPDAWLFMGDLHQAVGRIEEAQSTYAFVLEGLKQRVVSIGQPSSPLQPETS